MEEKDGYIVIRTPGIPEFWFGNFILFKSVPEESSYADWLRIHSVEFGDSLNHVTFGWDSEDQGVTFEFEQKGFKLFKEVALRTGAYRPHLRPNEGVVIRKLTQDWEWAAAIDMQITVDREDFDYGDSNRAFRTSQMTALRKMAEKGRGNWWGAFEDEKLVCSMGLYFDSDRRMGRFQYVTTDRAYRRQGICTTLLDAVSKNAFQEVGVSELVINTGDNDDNPARSVYRSYGFADGVQSYGLSKRL